ncbi:uncharacterized protein LOC128222520 [Mya arenaria]|uniref:uncharacterized protein LOC128222520 n=1 Tax=Mya arenaria TaxID=6604 RepID=UPI0022E390A6|nr:uncharacterized protein LOC128222520 [Mya arenaria]
MATGYRRRYEYPIGNFEETDTDTEYSDCDDFVCSDSGRRLDATIFNDWENLFKSQRSEENDQAGKLLCEIQTDENIAKIFGEIRQKYKSTDVKWSSSNIDEKKDQEAASLLNSAFESLTIDDEKSESSEGCSSCSESMPVLDVSQFKKGQHISMPGKFGAIYQHHAIVCDVKSTSGTEAELELIHFMKKENSIKICKEIKTYDLKNKQINLKHYIKQRYDDHLIISRAETVLQDFKMSKFEKYNFLLLNCEHFATWCVNGEEECFQVQGALQMIVDSLSNALGVGSRLVKAVQQLVIMSTDEIAKSIWSSIVPEIVLGATAGIYLVYCLAKTAYLIMTYKKNNLCLTCLKRTLLDMWLGFSVFCSTSVLQFLIYTFAAPAIGSGLGIPLILLTVLLSVVLKVSVHKILHDLRNPFGNEKTKISKPSQLSIADIVAFSYYKLEHVAIVSDILDVNEEAQTAKVICIHYGLPKLLAKRKIVEEEFEMNLAKSAWYKFDVDDTTSYSREKRLSRAKERVGEKRWSTTNRSDNFCHWAVVPNVRWDDYALGEVTVKEKKNKSVEPFLNTSPVYIAEELRLGDVVDYKETGILVRKQSNVVEGKKVVEIDLIITNFWQGKRKTYTLDLKRNDINVMYYKPALCISMQDRVERALNFERQGYGSWWTKNGFIQSCILKKEFLDN